MSHLYLHKNAFYISVTYMSYMLVINVAPLEKKDRIRQQLSFKE